MRDRNAWPTPDRLLWAIDVSKRTFFTGIVLWRLSTPLRIFTKVRKNRIFAAAKSAAYASDFFEVSSLTRHARCLVVPLLNKVALERVLALGISVSYLLSGKHGMHYVDQHRFCSAP
jgi:hypothetical protein